jgi:hypothetical protein
MTQRLVNVWHQPQRRDMASALSAACRGRQQVTRNSCASPRHHAVVVGLSPRSPQTPLRNHPYPPLRGLFHLRARVEQWKVLAAQPHLCEILIVSIFGIP